MGVAAAVIALVGFAPAQVAFDQSAYTHAQRLIDVGGGRRMNLYCSGSGSPTVVLDAGGGGSTLSWRYVQPLVATFTRVCSYDRAGAGFSDPGPLPRTTHAIVADLRRLLQRAGMRPPYVMVGHSMGGYDVRLFADLFTSEVAGMVLVDPSDENQDHRLNPLLPKLASFNAMQLAMLRRCARTPRWCVPPSNPSFGPQLNAAIRARALAPGAWADAASELASTYHADTNELARASRSYGKMPLIVLTGGAQFMKYRKMLGASYEQAIAARHAWSDMHDELARLSDRGVNEHVSGAGHDIEVDRPDVVVRAIKCVIEEARQE